MAQPSGSSSFGHEQHIAALFVARQQKARGGGLIRG
jgi:hypothetical protein